MIKSDTEYVNSAAKGFKDIIDSICKDKEVEISEATNVTVQGKCVECYKIIENEFEQYNKLMLQDAENLKYIAESFLNIDFSISKELKITD